MSRLIVIVFALAIAAHILVMRVQLAFGIRVPVAFIVVLALTSVIVFMVRLIIRELRGMPNWVTA